MRLRDARPTAAPQLKWSRGLSQAQRQIGVASQDRFALPHERERTAQLDTSDVWKRHLAKRARADERSLRLRNVLATTAQSTQTMREGLLAANVAADHAVDLAERMESNAEQLQQGWQGILKRSRLWLPGPPPVGTTAAGARYEPGTEKAIVTLESPSEWRPQRPPTHLTLDSSPTWAAATSPLAQTFPQAIHATVDSEAGALHESVATLTEGARSESPHSPSITKQSSPVRAINQNAYASGEMPFGTYPRRTR